MAKRSKIRLLLALIALLLLMGLYLLLGAGKELKGDGIYFIQEEQTEEMDKRRIEGPPVGLFGGSQNMPADRETRTVSYDQTKESRN